MGIDITTYLGPYFECKVQQKEKTDLYTACVNKQCSGFEIRSSHNFCPRCGQKIGIVESKELVDSVDEDDVYRALKGRLYPPSTFGIVEEMKRMGTCSWLENKDTPTVGIRFNPKLTALIENYDPERITREIVHFHRSLSEELEILRKYYGEENIKVKWGLLNMFS